jgi:diaminopimelate epimerase
VQLTKHHGLANDFLVVLDEANDRAVAVGPELAVRLCDRRTGLGADGLLHGAAPGPGADVDVVMHLFNADGSRAEMSGNGIRCLGQALVMARDVGEAVLVVGTDAGPRRLQVEPGGTASTVLVRLPDEVPAHLGVDEGRVASVSLGNPHVVVLVDDPEAVDLEADGGWVEQRIAGGANVEFIARTSPDHLELRVWERGVGATHACGTGACAAAHAAHRWGLVGDRVRVSMPGGVAEVDLGPSITLIGPADHVATIEIADD